MQVLWRRLDQPGHEACSLDQVSRGWAANGMAVFAESGVVTCIHYAVHFDAGWRSMGCEMSGWSGETAVAMTLTRDGDGTWQMGGDLCLDADGRLTGYGDLWQAEPA